MAQPDFQALTTGLQGLTTGLQGVSLEVSRLPNLPVINENNAILNQLREMQAQNQAFQAQNQAFQQAIRRELQEVRTELRTEIQQLRTNMDTGFDQVERRMNAADSNSIARNINSIINQPDTPLKPLKTVQNEDVDVFPSTLQAISRLQSRPLNEILERYGQEHPGNLEERKRQLKTFIGVLNERV